MTDEIDILAALLLHRYGGRLSAEQQAALRATLDAIAADIAAVRAASLPPEAAPVPTFVAVREEP